MKLLVTTLIVAVLGLTILTMEILSEGRMVQHQKVTDADVDEIRAMLEYVPKAVYIHDRYEGNGQLNYTVGRSEYSGDIGEVNDEQR